MTDGTQHLTGSQFLAQRREVAQSVEAQVPQMVALPGALTPIPVDRLEAHQADGLAMHEIVAYENRRFLEANGSVRERHAAWLRRDYDAQVQAQREIEAEKRRQEAEASAAYQRRVAELLAKRDSDAGNS